MAASFVLELDTTPPEWAPTSVSQEGANKAVMQYTVSEPAHIEAEVLGVTEPVQVFGGHLVLPTRRGRVRVTARDDVLNELVYEVDYALDYGQAQVGWVGEPRVGFVRHPTMGYLMRRAGTIARAAVGKVARATFGRIVR